MTIIGSTHKSIRFEFHVTGHLWGGGWGEYTYHLPSVKHPATLDEAKPLAGDFESLDSADIIKIETEATVSEKALI